MRRLRAAGSALGPVFRSPDLRRAQLSSGSAWTAELAFTTVLGVYAFEQGGAAAVGVVGFARIIPAAVVLPLVGTIADRLPRERLLVGAGLVRATATALAALAAALAAPALAVYALAVVATVAFTIYRPAHSALLPSLCHSPEELTGANVVRSFLDAASALVGPLIAAALLSAASVAAGFAATALLALYSAVAMAGVRCRRSPLTIGATGGIAAETAAGFRALAAERRAGLLVGLGALQAFVRGALTVFAVVAAIELIETGESGVGVLWAAFGAGGLAGAAATSLLLGHQRLAAVFGAGVALWGAPLVLLGAFPSEASALALLALVGCANAFVDVTIFTLLQRLMPDDMLARSLGLSEMAWTVALALGSLAAPLLISLLGIEGALVATGALLPMAALAAWPTLARIDRDVFVLDEEIALFRGVPLFRPLSVPVVEQLASRAEPVAVPAGRAVCREGEPGDRFYVIEAGSAEVLGGGVHIRKLGPGDCFGEIALLHQVPRTATVCALEDMRLRSLDAAAFVPCVSGSGDAHVAAESLIEERLATYSGAEEAAATPSA